MAYHSSACRTWLSHRDMVDLHIKSIEAPDDLLFDIFYGVSANTYRFWDIEHTKKTIGYAPQDDGERYRSFFEEQAKEG